MTADGEGFEPVEMIYGGRRMYHEGDKAIPGIVFFEAANPENDFSFNGKAARVAFRSAVIGGIYQLERRGPTFRFSSKFVRASDDPRVPAWRAKELAMDVAARAKRVIATEKDKANDSIYELLAPFRADYIVTDHIGRLAMEAVLLHALRRTW